MRFIIIYLLLFCSKSAFAQNHLSYLGSLILSNNSTISFKLKIIEKKGIVSGFSITNIGTKDETKSEIRGLYFKSDNSFQLKETKILSTNSNAALNTFCHINMQLSFKGIASKKRLEGTFVGNFSDSTECERGKIILMKEEELNKKAKRINKKVKKIKKKIKKNHLENNTNLIQQKKILKDDDNFSIKSESNKLTLLIWDGNEEDGDKIELTINKKIILTNFKTTKKRKKIKFKLKNGENIIEIKATNLGKSPPNTSKIELIDNQIRYEIATELKLQKSAIIKIIK